MAFDLNVTFVGMCLFVPAPAGPSPTELHVILVNADDVRGGHQAHHGNHRHHAHLFYDAAYDHPDQQPTGARFSSIGLTYKVLDLSMFSGTLDPTLSDVPNLSAISGKTVPGLFITDHPGKRVAARVKLGAGKAIGQFGEAEWELEPPPAPLRKIAFKVVWRIEGIATEKFDWGLDGLDGKGGQPLVSLHPKVDAQSPSGKSVHLRVVNVPQGELFPADPDANAPEPGTAAPHYEALYGLFAEPHRRLKPIWRGEGSGGPRGSSYTCMVGQAGLSDG